MRRSALVPALLGLPLCLSLAPASLAAGGTEQADLHSRTLAIASGTAIGGQPERAATEIGSRAAMRKFARKQDVAELKDDLLAAYADARPKESVWAAVVSVGCDVPPDVDVTGTTEQVYLDPQPVEDPLPECFAAVTSVAVVAVR